VKWNENSETVPYTSTSITLMIIALLCDVGLGSHQAMEEKQQLNSTKHKKK